MAAILIVVFLFVLLFTIIPEFLPFISKKLVEVVHGATNEELNLREQLCLLQEDLAQINMVDEFAKYAKTERKINRAKDLLKKYRNSRSEVFIKIKLGATAVYHVLQVVCFISLIWKFRGSPLLELPPSWVYPVHKIIAFPTGIPGGVGITFWMLASRSAVQKIVEMIQSRRASL